MDDNITDPTSLGSTSCILGCSALSWRGSPTGVCFVDMTHNINPYGTNLCNLSVEVEEIVEEV